MQDRVNEQRELPRSQLFLVRMWEEQLGDGDVEWRGRVQDVATGEAAYFREWEGLVGVIRRILEARRSDSEDDAAVSE